jgi:hypothetical protein
MGPFGLGNGAFDSCMIDLSVIVSTLSLGIEIGVGASGNYEDCAIGGEGIELLWRRWQRVGFGLDLRIGVVWHWVCKLWHCQRVCYLWSW